MVERRAIQAALPGGCMDAQGVMRAFTERVRRHLHGRVLVVAARSGRLASSLAREGFRITLLHGPGVDVAERDDAVAQGAHAQPIDLQVWVAADRYDSVLGIDAFNDLDRAARHRLLAQLQSAAAPQGLCAVRSPVERAGELRAGFDGWALVHLELCVDAVAAGRQRLIEMIIAQRAA